MIIKKPVQSKKNKNNLYEEYLNNRADELRMNPTIAEQNVINFLNRNHIKYCFQKPILITKKRGYIVDFIIYIADEKRFVLEIDGSSHRGNENNDKKRTEELKKKGYIVRRMSNYNTDKERIERVFSNIAMPIVLSKK